MNPKITLEFKVGVFVLVGLVIMVFMVFFITDFQIVQPKYNVKIIFNYANGVKNNSPLRIAGVDAGEIKNVNVLPTNANSDKTLVELDAWIRKDILVPQDSKVFINTLGLLGEKYVEIMPGVDYANVIKSGESIRGEDPVPMHDVGVMIQDMANDLKNVVDNINSITSSVEGGEGTIGKLLASESIYENLDELVLDIKNNPWKLFYKTREKKVSK